jgi:hypothetical protein
MKILGTILLILGILSLIGGLASPSDTDPSVVIFGYVLKIGLIIGGILLLSKKKPQPAKVMVIKNESIDHGMSEDIVKNPIQDELSSISKQIESVSELKAENLLTKEEYDEKIKILRQKEQEIIRKEGETQLKLKEKRLNSLANKQIDSIVKKLDDLLSNGVLTQDEYKIKRELALMNAQKQLLENPCKKQDFNKLKEWQKRAVRDYYLKSNGEYIILLKWRKGNIYSFSEEEFVELKIKEDLTEYYQIELPTNFDPHYY